MPQLFDVVYILKEDIDPKELRYSLRSVAANFPHRSLWFVGGQPAGFTPDGRIIHKQCGANKWENVKSSLFEIIRNKDITEDFYLFNDDFFVMQPFTGDFINYAGGTLEHRIQELHRDTGGTSPYCKMLEKTRAELLSEGYDSISFCVHLPMLINKTKLADILSTLGSPMFRSVYGNMARIPYIYHEDVKIYDRETVPSPDCDYLSTMEDSFNFGKVGEYIRAQFPKPCRFEERSHG